MIECGVNLKIILDMADRTEYNGLDKGDKICHILTLLSEEQSIVEMLDHFLQGH
jgi:hypothetical protein